MSRARRMLAWALIWGCMTVPAIGASFTDLDGEDPRATLATLLAQKGIVPGGNESEFEGNSPLSRYELAASLNALLDPHDVPFNVVAWSDIPPGHPAMPSVSRVTSLNLLAGDGGRFSGLRAVKRVEFVEALLKLLNYRAVSAPPSRKNSYLSFSDIPGSTQTGRMLDRAANYWQIIEAPARSRFRPTDLVTRFEALEMLARTILLLDDTSLKETVKEALAKLQAPTPAPTEAPAVLPTPAPTPTPRIPREVPTPYPTLAPLPALTPVPVRTPTPVLTPKPAPTPAATPVPAPTPHRPFWVKDAPASPAPSSAPSFTPTPAPVPSPALTPAAASTPHRPFWETASPAPVQTPAPAATVPPTAAPTNPPVTRATPKSSTAKQPPPVMPEGGVFRNQARAGFNLVLYYRDGVPGNASLASSTDKSDLQAMVPGFLNFALSGQGWFGDMGGSGGVSTIYPVAVALGSAATDLLAFNAHGEGLYRLPMRGKDWETAAGVGLSLGVLNGSGTDYLTTTKTTFGLGPAGQMAVRLMPGLVMTSAMQLYPLLYQSHAIAGSPKGAMRLGAATQVGVDYEVMRSAGMLLTGGLHYQGSLGIMLDGTALQTVHLFSFGVGGQF